MSQTGWMPVEEPQASPQGDTGTWKPVQGPAPDHAQPESFWRTVYDRSGLGAIQKLSGSLSDWAQEHAQRLQTEEEAKIKPGEEGSILSQINSPRAGADMLARGAKLLSGAFSPKSVALTAGTIAANTNPVTGIPVDVALAAHGGYGVAKAGQNIAERGLNPENAEAGLLSGAEAIGGAAGVKGMVRPKVPVGAMATPAATAPPIAPNVPPSVAKVLQSTGFEYVGRSPSMGITEIRQPGSNISVSILDKDLGNTAVIQSKVLNKLRDFGKPLPSAIPPPAQASAGTNFGANAAVNAAQSHLAPIEPLAALTKAIKPGTNITGWDSAVKTAIPELLKVHETAPITSLDSLSDAITTAKKSLWSQYKKVLGPNADLTVDGGQIADAMKGSINARYRAQYPESAAALDKVADTYNRPLTLNQAEDYLQSANNDLHSYYAKNKVGQNVAKGDPSISHVVAEPDGLRNALYDKLDEATGTNAARDLKKKYGALSTLEEPVLKRKNVYARQQPDSLQEQLNVAQGAAKVGKAALNLKPGDVAEGLGQMAVSKFLKQRGDSNWLVNHAFDRLSSGVQPSNPLLSTLPSRFAATTAMQATGSEPDEQ